MTRVPDLLPGGRWRCFRGAREPAALRVMALLTVIFALQTGLLLHGADALPGRTLMPWGLTLLALLLSPWWSQPALPASPEFLRELPSGVRRQVWVVAGALAILGMWPRSARLDDGLSGVEIRNLETAYRYSREHPVTAEDDKMEPVGAPRLVLPEAAAQFALAGRRMDAGMAPRPGRLLPWMAGVVTPGLAVLLAAAMGRPRSGLAAGLILAMHPWHVRWSAEISNHALEMAGWGAALLCLFRAMSTGRWRWWLGLGLAQGVILCGLSAALPGLAVFNLLAVAASGPGRGRIFTGCRLSVVLAVAALPLMAASPYGEPFAAPAISLPDVWGRLVTGFSWSAAGFCVERMMEVAPWRGAVIGAVLPAALLAGLYFMCRQDWRTRLVAGLAVTGAIVSLRGDAAGLLLLLFPLLGVWGVAGLADRFSRRLRPGHAPLFLAVIYVFTTSPALNRVMQVPADPVREAVLAARSGAGPQGMTAVAGSGRMAARYYDPAVAAVPDAGALSRLADEAYESGVPLWVCGRLAEPSGGEEEAVRAELETGGRFVPVREFRGLESGTSWRLYRYQPREQIIRLNVKPG